VGALSHHSVRYQAQRVWERSHPPPRTPLLTSPGVLGSDRPSREVLDAMPDASPGLRGSIPATQVAHGDPRGESE